MTCFQQDTAAHPQRITSIAQTSSGEIEPTGDKVEIPKTSRPTPCTVEALAGAQDVVNHFIGIP
jgi:hypothetical protein